MRPPSAYTASVTTWCSASWSSLVSIDWPDATTPVGCGAYPPVTIRATPARAFGEVGREPGSGRRVVLQAGVHRAHHHAVRQGDRAQPQRGEQVRVLHEK